MEIIQLHSCKGLRLPLTPAKVRFQRGFCTLEGEPWGGEGSKVMLEERTNVVNP
jgi:hypothetical protein